MKSKIITLLFVMTSFFVSNLYSQFIYEDAKKLSSMIKLNPQGNYDISDSITFNAILLNYCEKNQENASKNISLISYNNTSGDPVYIQYSKNKYISKYLNIEYNPKQETSFFDYPLKEIDKMGNAIINSAIENAKAELLNTVFAIFRSDFDSTPELQSIYPETYKFLNQTKNVDFNLAMPILREGFKTDILNLFNNIPELYFSGKYYKESLNNITVKNNLTPVNAIYDLVNNVNPVDIIDGLTVYANDSKTKSIFVSNKEKETKINSDNFSSLENSINYFRLISNSLRTLDSGKSIWVKHSQFKNNIDNNSIFRDMYLGLITQISNKIYIKDIGAGGIPKYYSLSDELENENKTLTFLEFSKKFLKLANQVENNLNLLNGDNENILNGTISDKQVIIDDYAQYMNSFVDLFSMSLNSDKVFQTDNGKPNNSINSFINILKTYKNIYLDINKNNYYSAILNLSYLNEQVYYSSIADMNTLGSDNIRIKDINSKISKYGIVMASLADESNKNDYESILRNYIIKENYGTVKRNNGLNIFINSYVGIYLGKEKENALNIWNLNRGFTAPIGLELSYGAKNAGSISAFIPVLDFGSSLDFKKVDESNTETQIKIENIFSPGLYIVYGIPFFSASIGAGFQIKPFLNNINNKNNYRFNIFAAFDLPIFKF